MRSLWIFTDWRRLGLVTWLMLSLFSLILLLSGCAAVVVGGAAVGAAAIHDRRDYTTMLDDQQIEMSASAALAKDKHLGEHRVGVTSYNRNVLLTGQAQNEATATRIAAIVSQQPKVQRVVDEVTLGPPISLTQVSNDVLITSKAKFALTKVSIPGFDATRVKVVTDDSVVYLLGMVSPKEADAAAEQVSFVPGVKRVVKLFEYEEPKA